jgi:hypothetical protein
VFSVLTSGRSRDAFVAIRQLSTTRESTNFGITVRSHELRLLRMVQTPGRKLRLICCTDTLWFRIRAVLKFAQKFKKRPLKTRLKLKRTRIWNQKRAIPQHLTGRKMRFASHAIQKVTHSPQSPVYLPPRSQLLVQICNIIR